jgi:hypothetical protein
LGDAADEVAHSFNQSELSESDRVAFWRGYRQVSDPAWTEHLAERVRWWEPATVLGSAFFLVESWSRRATADGLDPSTPKPQTCYDTSALRRLKRAEALLEALSIPD